MPIPTTEAMEQCEWMLGRRLVDAWDQVTWSYGGRKYHLGVILVEVSCLGVISVTDDECGV